MRFLTPANGSLRARNLGLDGDDDDDMTEYLSRMIDSQRRHERSSEVSDRDSEVGAGDDDGPLAVRLPGLSGDEYDIESLLSQVQSDAGRQASTLRHETEEPTAESDLIRRVSERQRIWRSANSGTSSTGLRPSVNLQPIANMPGPVTTALRPWQPTLSSRISQIPPRRGGHYTKHDLERYQRARALACAMEILPTSILSPGACFSGRQMMGSRARHIASSLGMPTGLEEWKLELEIRAVDWSARKFSGVMQGKSQ